MDISNRDKWYRIYVVPVFVNDALDHSFSDQIKKPWTWIAQPILFDGWNTINYV